MKLKIRILDGNDTEIDVPNNSSIDTLCKLISEKIDMPKKEQRLIFRGQLLQPESLLSDYHIEDGCTIHLVRRNNVN